MLRAVDLFTGIGGIEAMLHDTYSDIVEEDVLNSIISKCFSDIQTYDLDKTFHPSQKEYQDSRHLADIDIIELLRVTYVRNHRDYKYCRGKPDTAEHVVRIMADNGVYISLGKYNNWRRNTGYRLIDAQSLDLILELLKISPDNFKRLVYAHIAMRREIREKEENEGILLGPDAYLMPLMRIFDGIKFARPPCRQLSVSMT